MQDKEKLDQIRNILKEWFNDEPGNGDNYMCKIRDIIDK